MNYISNTGIISPNYEINKPHIIIDKNSSDWFYFLNKHEYRDRYVLHYIDNIE